MKMLWIVLFCATPLLANDSPAVVTCAKAAENFLGTLDSAQKAKVLLPMSVDERENFHYTPRVRAGLSLKEMNEAQRAAAMNLLQSAMSEKGSLKATQIMSLESVLAKLENGPIVRDSELYYVSIFGSPGDPKGWAWRFEGHHLSVNITLVEGKGTSVTPSFLGSNPAEVREGEKKGLRVLAAEEDLARALVTTLLADGKAGVIFSEKPPKEILSFENRKASVLEPVGILASELSETQRAALISLIAEYTGRYRTEVAATDMEKIQAAGIGKIRFGWAGSPKVGEAYYYRIQGPTFLMELANVQNQANHVHATWRDFSGDFGRDILSEHLREGH